MRQGAADAPGAAGAVLVAGAALAAAPPTNRNTAHARIWSRMTTSSVYPGRHARACRGHPRLLMRTACRLSLDLNGAGFEIPVQNLLAGPVYDAVKAAGVLVDRLEIFDPMRLAADVRVNSKGEDFRPLPAFSVKPVELIDGAAHQILALVMLDDHHRDVVELDRVRQGEQRSCFGADHRRLVVVYPVTDISDAGGGEDFRRVEGLRQPWAEPAEGAFAAEALDDAERSLDHRFLIWLGVDRVLFVRVA